MANREFAFHYVCTPEEARNLAFRHHRYWVLNCGCREQRGHCNQSRIDVCLAFAGTVKLSGSGLKEIGLTEVLALFDEASEKRLVARPYRNEQNPQVTDGICFCCKDCCDYFIDPGASKCDKGYFIEHTDMSQCNFCGDCIETCYFNARKLADGELELSRINCYGCGLCVDLCPEKCIAMVRR